MISLTAGEPLEAAYSQPASFAKRIESIDLLRGIVMIVMALDHVRDYFHQAAFFYSPTDLSQTAVATFATRFITHYCAPVFVFLSGISAYLNGMRKTKKELATYLFTRGIWLMLVEVVVISFGWFFNPRFQMFNLQVLWATGISMVALSALIFLDRKYILTIALSLIVVHNFLDPVSVAGTGARAFFWAVLHHPGMFLIGHSKLLVLYPVLPWIGIIAAGYCAGSLFEPGFNTLKRQKTLRSTGFLAIAAFAILRTINVYGDPTQWSVQKSNVFTFLSFLNVTKYPPSLLYILITLGPAMIVLSMLERPLNRLTEKIVIFGRVPFFYYVLHIYLIHLLALAAAGITGYTCSAMILSTRINSSPELKGYGFNLPTVYMIWILVVVALYPLCAWFNRYKRAHQTNNVWLTYV